MDFRYQEVLTWIVPGFYLIAYAFGVAWLIIPTEGAMSCFERLIKGLVRSGDGFMPLMLFAVPILSLIVGWIVNCYAGLLFRCIIKDPFVKAYKKVTGDSTASEENAEKEFDRVRELVDLDKLDRFYYRYVFSRNMFMSQLILTLVMVLLWLIIGVLALCGVCFVKIVVLLILFLITVAIGAFYIPCVKRDLFTHAKFVFLLGVKEKKLVIATQTSQNPDNQQGA